MTQQAVTTSTPRGQHSHRTFLHQPKMLSLLLCAIVLVLCGLPSVCQSASVSVTSTAEPILLSDSLLSSLQTQISSLTPTTSSTSSQVPSSSSSSRLSSSHASSTSSHAPHVSSAKLSQHVVHVTYPDVDESRHAGFSWQSQTRFGGSDWEVAVIDLYFDQPIFIRTQEEKQTETHQHHHHHQKHQPHTHNTTTPPPRSSSTLLPVQDAEYFISLNPQHRQLLYGLSRFVCAPAPGTSFHGFVLESYPEDAVLRARSEESEESEEEEEGAYPEAVSGPGQQLEEMLASIVPSKRKNKSPNMLFPLASAAQSEFLWLRALSSAHSYTNSHSAYVSSNHLSFAFLLHVTHFGLFEKLTQTKLPDRHEHFLDVQHIKDGRCDLFIRDLQAEQAANISIPIDITWAQTIPTLTNNLGESFFGFVNLSYDAQQTVQHYHVHEERNSVVSFIAEDVSISTSIPFLSVLIAPAVDWFLGMFEVNLVDFVAAKLDFNLLARVLKTCAGSNTAGADISGTLGGLLGAIFFEKEKHIQSGNTQGILLENGFDKDEEPVSLTELQRELNKLQQQVNADNSKKNHVHISISHEIDRFTDDWTSTDPFMNKLRVQYRLLKEKNLRGGEGVEDHIHMVPIIEVEVDEDPAIQHMHRLQEQEKQAKQRLSNAEKQKALEASTGLDTDSLETLNTFYSYAVVSEKLQHMMRTGWSDPDGGFTAPLIKSLSDQLIPKVGNSLVESWTAKLRWLVHNNLVESTRHWLTKQLSYDIAKSVVPLVVTATVKNIPELVNADIPAKIERNLRTSVHETVSRSLAHGVALTLHYTLRDVGRQEPVCYYCEYLDTSYCHLCYRTNQPKLAKYEDMYAMNYWVSMYIDHYVKHYAN